jgi:tetratricopeptide (TPR) repeat protein
MTRDRWSLIEEIFQNALDRPASERNDYVEQACGDDEELRSEIASLLANENEATMALRPLVAGDIRGLAEASTSAEAGLRLGPYLLVRELDHGGMGVIYLAVRSDDTYFQIVAIKMIRKGLESPALLGRFRAERQILATLTHPNIGAILDGGETPDGRPFIVMEYVEGQPITLASKSRDFSIRQRIKLFRSLCSAVHYAHQKSIIHRDIKPSNVLVTPEGGVKLIDFGVSKPLALEPILAELPHTESGQRLMTPDYASPEQLLGQELTTTTDIYSMGVLLFELLTGSRPYTLSNLSPAAAERIVCHHESWKPSAVPGLPERTRKALVGDLDRIVQMAMDTDPSRRYQSAQDFEGDLFRYLQGRPVVARKATALYRLGKFVQRHRMGSAMACATLVVLLGSILFHQWQSRLADRRVMQAAALADSAISDLTGELEQSSVPTDKQAALFQRALNYLEKLRQSSGDDPRLLVELSKAYGRVGDLQGAPTAAANLGDTTAAVASYETAVHLALEAQKRLPGEESSRAMIDAYQKLGAIQFAMGNAREAYDNYQKAVKVGSDLWRQSPDDPNRKRVLANNYAGLGELELHNFECDKALTSFRAGLQILGADPNGDFDHDHALIQLHWYLGRTLNQVGSQSEAVANLQRSIDIAEGLARQFPSSAQVKRIVSVVYGAAVGPLAGEEMLNVGNPDQAQAYARKSLAIVEASAGADNTNVQARYGLATGYQLMGDSHRSTQPATASKWYRKAISLIQQMANHREAQVELADLDDALAVVLTEKRDLPERLRVLREENAIRQEFAMTGLNTPRYRLLLLRSYCELSDAELAAGNTAEARSAANAALPILDEFSLTSPSLFVLRDLGYCYEVLGNVQGRAAMERSLPVPERNTARVTSHDWYQKNAEVWKEWNRRGAATTESELERARVEHLLGK